MITKLSSFDGVEISNDGDFLVITQHRSNGEESDVVQIPYDYLHMFAKELNKSIDDMDVLNGVI